MAKPKKYQDLYGAQSAYRQTDKGKETLKRYNTSDAARLTKRDWKRKHDGTVVDKQQWFIDTYGDIGPALGLLKQKEKIVVAHLYGLDGSEPLTQDAIATMMGCTQQSVSKLKKKAMAKLNASRVSVS